MGRCIYLSSECCVTDRPESEGFTMRFLPIAICLSFLSLSAMARVCVLEDQYFSSYDTLGNLKGEQRTSRYSCDEGAMVTSSGSTLSGRIHQVQLAENVSLIGCSSSHSVSGPTMVRPTSVVSVFSICTFRD